MCGIVGFINYKKIIPNYKSVLNNMLQTLSHRGSDEKNSYINKNVCIGSTQFINQISNNLKQPLIEKYSFGEYVIVSDSQIYNAKELKETLIENGFSFNSYSDTEILLKGYIHYKTDIVNQINGVFSFAIWNTKTQELFIARDRFGIKPLFYTQSDDGFIFASELKAIFEYPGIQKVLDSQGVSELFGLGPANTPGLTVYKNIFEIKPGHFAIYNQAGLHIEKYWELKTRIHLDDFQTTCITAKDILEDSINRQIPSDMSICTFLSGGLDSSILSYYISNYRKENGLSPLDTYSVDYVDNDKNFIKSDFQPNSDNYYIKLMTENIHSTHHSVMLDTPDLANALEDVLIARDVPGMADVDSSLYLFCKEVKKEKNISLMGECADEVFGGYPWFFRDDALNSGTFPWSIAIDERQKILHPDISKKVHLKEYIDFRYNQTLANVEILDNDSYETSQKRKISYLTIKWFMNTLITRADRMSMANGFEVRVPFCDYRLVEYMYNVPWEMKAYNGREKGLLRHIMKGILPDEIVDRKKSPYPKTHNPTYLHAVKTMLTDIMKNNDSPINYLLNREYILEILNTDGKAFSRPWFGQLMTGPQLIAYLCQVNMWLEKYQPRIEL